jgi:hypothetical protein
LTGELAFNVADGKLYYKDLSNNVQVLVSAGTGGGTVTQVDGSGGTTGLTLTGGPITSVGTLTLGGTLGFANGGTGQTSYTNGQLLIGNTLTGGLSKATLTAGANVTITNGNGTITIASTGGGGGGGVTSVGASYPITVTGTTTPTIGIASSAGACTTTTGTGDLVFATGPTITLANATGLPLTTGVTGVLPVANGGTGVTASTGTGSVVLSNSPTLVTPALGTPSAINIVNATGLTSTQVTLALGYTPYNSTNPAGFVTSSGSVAFATNAGNASTASSPASGGSFITSSNIGSQTVSAAATAGSATTAAGLSGTPNISVGTVTASGDITPSGTGHTTNLGSSSNNWGTLYARGISNGQTGDNLVALTLNPASGALNFSGFTSIFGNKSGIDLACDNGSGGYKIPLQLTNNGKSVVVGGTSAPSTYAFVSSLNNVGTSGIAGQFDASQYGGSYAITCQVASTGSLMAGFYYGTSSPSLIGTISTDGSSVSYNTTSDYRLKENVNPISGALDKVKLLRPVTYTWKNAGTPGEGFIAHELQAVVPSAVHGEKDAVDTEGNPIYQGIDQSKLVATLTAALQEAIARIEVLEAKVGK